jgi:hypothetical protein
LVLLEDDSALLELCEDSTDSLLAELIELVVDSIFLTLLLFLEVLVLLCFVSVVSEDSSSAESSSSSTNSSESAPVNNVAPYAVDMTQISNPATFNLRGVNVPPSITLQNNGGTIVTFASRQLHTVAYMMFCQCDLGVYFNCSNAAAIIRENTNFFCRNRSDLSGELISRI